ncbi:uncharacterized protein LOC119986739 isoform X2 [Tripterygium wilfordii]|uniref:uncharacterized protein LOC119986739 isoform X1 n=1 Tax=Tripterygium wilfordii TaxID=458696 RepID=UPI0018F818CC|nr:uncharacterized protein LOC119986739 isoform X1 [Tripterygium wilfordii]XP_038687348.1 uncharacterized protein LOC119986739 isoform X2 [Tripterygium wilfordii]
MAGGWVKSLQCKSRAFDDVYHPNPKNLRYSASCRKSAQNVKDVIESATKHKHSSKPKKPTNRQNPISKHPRPEVPVAEGNIVRSRTVGNPEPFFPALAELPEGHPSRNVVEIIFHTSWSPKAFTGRIDVVFKIQNGSKTVARFEEYREMVKARAVSDGLDGASTWEENARCVADGNEVMRFYCLGPAGGPYDACGDAWTFSIGKGSPICTFSGSGGAHESAGGGRGRRAMLVCRVIAGRVSKQIGLDSLLNGRVGFDSVSGDNGELLVFDSRAVLPCFLIIYKL